MKIYYRYKIKLKIKSYASAQSNIVKIEYISNDIIHPYQLFDGTVSNLYCSELKNQIVEQLRKHADEYFDFEDVIVLSYKETIVFNGVE